MSLALIPLKKEQSIFAAKRFLVKHGRLACVYLHFIPNPLKWQLIDIKYKSTQIMKWEQRQQLMSSINMLLKD